MIRRYNDIFNITGYVNDLKNLRELNIFQYYGDSMFLGYFHNLLNVQVKGEKIMFKISTHFEYFSN